MVQTYVEPVLVRRFRKHLYCSTKGDSRVDKFEYIHSEKISRINLSLRYFVERDTEHILIGHK